MPREHGLRAHIITALAVALQLALCQVVIETVLIAGLAHRFVLSPYAFSIQMYDFCVKLFLLAPGAGQLLEGTVLDRFLAAGFTPKLALGGSLLLPNVVVAALVGVLIGITFRVRGRRAAPRPVLLALVVLATVIHLASWIREIHIPDAWSLWIIMRNAARVFFWGGTYLALITIGVAGAATIAIIGRSSYLRWGAALSIVGTGILILLTSLLAGPQSPGAVQARTGTSPTPWVRVANVILISIDSLRADRVGCYGNKREVSPTLDRLAAEGVRFSETMSTTSWTLPAHMSLLTGRYLLSHGVITLADRLPDGVPTLAGQLRAAGLATGAIVSVPQLGAAYGFGRGFDDYDDQTIPSPTWYDALTDEPAPTVTSLGIKWVQNHWSKRFFLFLHYWDVHYDYAPPAPYDTMFDPDYRGTVTGVGFFDNESINAHMPQRDLEHIMAAYDGEIRWVDDHIGQLVAALEELDLMKNTAIIITADHGDEFFEHGAKAHGRTLYREVVHVPLIIRAPGIPPGQVIDAPASLADIMPTVLELTGSNSPPELDGTSLLPTILHRRTVNRSGVHGWLCHLKYKANCLAMQSSPAGTLIHSFQPMRIEFYGPEDIHQRTNLTNGSGWPGETQLAQLNQELDTNWHKYRELGNSTEEIELSPSTLEHLRALGYLE